MASYKLQVRPRGWEDAPQSERFDLADMDHWLPKAYVQIAEVFELPPAADQDAIVNNMTKGLESALGQFPMLAGALYTDETSGRMAITKEKDSSVTLHVKTVRDEAGDLPSFQYLNERDFPAHLIHGPLVLPPSVTEKQLLSPKGDDSATGSIISTFQLTFIPGGLILAMATHHSCSDGPGCNRFLATWAQGSAESTRGCTPKPAIKADPSRSRLSATRPDKTRWKQLDERITVLKDLGGPIPPPPAGFKMPDLKARMWHFPRSSTLKLKAESSRADGGTWISTYDAIMALLWKTTTRAKTPLLDPTCTKSSRLIHAVNVRHVVQPSLPDRYFGNAVVLAPTSPMPVQDVMSGSDLPKLATAIREATKAVTPQYVSETLEWVAGLDNPRHIAWDVDAFLGMDLCASSWQSMTPHEDHDHGFGLPKALRFPNPEFEGFVFVLPSRRGVKPDAADEGVEVCICLEASCQDRLMQDQELLRYAQPRGGDA